MQIFSPSGLLLFHITFLKGLISFRNLYTCTYANKVLRGCIGVSIRFIGCLVGLCQTVCGTEYYHKF